LSCPTCGQALLQLDATFLSQTGKIVDDSIARLHELSPR